VGHFLDDFFVRTHYLSPVDGSAWPRWWPIYYWAIWLAYAPLIGMFLARLVRGRTIRQFMFMNLFLPAIFGLVWFSVFAARRINLELTGQGLWDAIHEGGKLALEKSVFEFLKFFPLTKVISWIFMGTVFISIVTMADSMTSTVASLSTTAAHQEGLEPPAAIKIFWGVVMSSVPSSISSAAAAAARSAASTPRSRSPRWRDFRSSSSWWPWPSPSAG
jgi:choline-glycine betaine transporter